MKYSGIGVFKHCFNDKARIPQFEERVVLTEAGSIEEAENVILKEFSEYASEGVKFLEVYEISEIFEGELNRVIEVSSTMKVFSGSNEEFIEKYWSSQRPKSCNNVGWDHVWFNRGNNKSGCYNCEEEREGELWKKA